MKKSLRILMVEDSAADAELIVAQLEAAGLSVNVQRVDTRDAFIEGLADFAPTLVLCDHSLASFNACAALETLRQLRPGVPLIVVTGALDERMAVMCLRAGAEDLVLKSRLARLPASIAAARAVRKRLDKLTPRQLQVMRLVAEGYSTPDVAARLHLSTKTVETHRSELMKRLGIHDVVRLVRYAVRVGVVSADD